jgi:hypothetical protein
MDTFLLVNSTKVFHKAVIETSKPLKTSYLINIHWSKPILNSFKFGCINLYSMLRDNITKKDDLIFAKSALLNVRDMSHYVT